MAAHRGTTIYFHPDPEILGADVAFNPKLLYEMALARARLYGGVKILWACESEVADGQTPIAESFHFPNGWLENST
jgi:topoisomerase-4 subunit B